MKYKYLFTNFGDNDFWSYYTEALSIFYKNAPMDEAFLGKTMNSGLINKWINSLAMSLSLNRSVEWSIESCSKYNSMSYSPVSPDYFDAEFFLAKTDKFKKKADNGETFWLNLETGEVGSA